MPSRRNTLIGLGMLTAGGAGAVATGAFSAATAERDVTAEFTGDASAVLGFDPTSPYADLQGESGEPNVLSITFDDLSANANFTFEDTFRVINRGTNDVQLVSVRSSDDADDWNEEPFQALIGEEAEKWQGNPNSEYYDEDISVDGDVGYFFASELGDGGENDVGPTMDAPADQGQDGGWVSVGFRFGSEGSVGGWDADNAPDNIQLEFQSVTQE